MPQAVAVPAEFARGGLREHAARAAAELTNGASWVGRVPLGTSARTLLASPAAWRTRSSSLLCSCAVVGSALFAAACAVEEPADRELCQLERVVFVPPAPIELPTLGGPALVCGNTLPLLVDRCEVTRAEWLEHRAALGQPEDPNVREFQSDWTGETANWPASFFSLDEAREFARARGMRLLRATEWLRVAMGSTPQAWPWGIPAYSLANTLELELRRPAPVGTFESGRSPLGAYDMIGNVWEWVEEPLQATLPGGSELTSLSWAMGGSYHSRLEPLFGFDVARRLVLNRLDLDPRARADDVGLRCCVEAEGYLMSRAHSFGASAAARRRIVAVGKAWGRDSLGLLEKLAARAGAPKQIEWLLEGARS